MRLAIIGLACLLLSGCAGTEPYTQQDLQQVRQTYVRLLPIYRTFIVAFTHNDLRAMQTDLRSEHAECHGVDQIDNRDTIDPNTQLFSASAELDGMCNDMEMAYTEWRKDHHMSYDANMPVPEPGQEFTGSEAGIPLMKKWLAHPAALS